MKRSNISQQTIARELGVSQALVSLVLNGKRENINEETYSRIWDYATRKGYRPKGMLQNQRAASTNVGFILRAGLRLYTQSNFFSHVQHGLHVALQDRGYSSVFLGSEDVLKGKALEERLERNHLHGIVVLGEVDPLFLRHVKQSHQRVVAVSARYPGLCHSVMPNEAQALELLVEHLTMLGHRNFAWIGGNKKLRQNQTRHAALIEALRFHELKLPEKHSVDVPGGDRVDGRKAAEEILRSVSSRGFPTAWVCLNGLIARGAINYLAQTGRNVPEGISVVAVDATRVCEEEHPEITGANADPEKMGMKAAELLLQSSGQDDDTFTDVVLPAELTVRQSSGKVK